MISKVFLVLIIVILAFAFPKISAQLSTDTCSSTTKVDCYNETGFRLTSNPVICMNIPTDHKYQSLPYKANEFLASSVSEWSSLLNQGGQSRTSIWKIQSMPTASDICNIMVDFLEKPSSSNSPTDNSEEIGLTEYDFKNHKAHVHIYYDKIASQSHTINCEGFENGTMYCDSSVPPELAIATKTYITTNYADELAPDYQLQWTFRHELGHAFGLGHYIPSDTENKKWTSGLIDAPSIMVEAIPLEGVYQFSISQVDVKQLQSLYYNKGFVGNPQTSPAIQTPTLSPKTQSTPPQSPVVPSSSSTPIPSWIKNNADYWSIGSIGDGDFIKGIQYLIQKNIISIPPTTQGTSSQNTIPSWVKSDAKFWAHGDMTDNDFIRAIQFLVQQGIIKVS